MTNTIYEKGTFMAQFKVKEGNTSRLVQQEKLTFKQAMLVKDFSITEISKYEQGEIFFIIVSEDTGEIIYSLETDFSSPIQEIKEYDVISDFLKDFPNEKLERLF